jgi:thiamine transporter ThiT
MTYIQVLIVSGIMSLISYRAGWRRGMGRGIVTGVLSAITTCRKQVFEDHGIDILSDVKKEDLL